MSTKRIFHHLLVVTLAVGMTVVTGCKNDDDTVEKVTLDIDSNLLKNGVEAKAESNVMNVPVACTGEWTAALDEDCDWCRLDDQELTYKGNRTLRLVFDENETGRDRLTTLFIEANGEIKEMPVRQKSHPSRPSSPT